MQSSPASVPVRWRGLIIAMATTHLAIVLVCLTSSSRLSNFGINLLSFLSPYVVSLNLRMDLHPLAVTNPSVLEAPLEVEFQLSDTDEWIQWSKASKVNDGTRTNKIRQQRYFSQIAGLLEVKSEDGISTVVSAMLKDLESRAGNKQFNRFRILHLPLVQANEWEIAERFRREGNLPEALVPEVVMTASIVRLA